MPLLGFLMVLAAVTFTEQAQVAVTEEMRTVATANNDFTMKFTQYLKQKSSGENAVFSPVSASSVLAGLTQGAAGNTRSQLLAALALPDNDNYIRSGYRTIINSYDSSLNGNVTLNMADAMFVANKFTPKESFVNMMQRDFKSQVQTLDFLSDNSAATDSINNWVSQKTNGKIEKLYESGDLRSSTQLVLANAVYFKGTWKVSFDKDSTSKKTFYLSSAKTVEVDMMNVESDFVVYSDNNLQANVLEIPYSGEEMKMMIVLPFETDGLDKTIKNLNGIPKPVVNIAEDYSIYVPKFTITSTMDVVEMIKSFGVTDAFSEDADFSKLSSQSIGMNSMKQKAYVEVNEEGTEAAAATGGDEIPGPAPPTQTPEFVVDHPFLYFIVHVPTDTAVFAGYTLSP